MKGYKITNKDMTCREYQYELNKEFILEGKLKICNTGFHFCEKAEDCFIYYDFTDGQRIFEVDSLGNIITEGNKSVTDKIIFIRELTKEELYIIFSDPIFGNQGKNNIGYFNTGNNNTGKNNIGKFNIGNNNKGNWNQGNGNKGNHNQGDENVGNNNIGNNNIGNGNTGNNNTGNNNKGNYNKF